MDSPDLSRVFAAAVFMLGNAPCPECGCAHDANGWNADCGWCTDRAWALNLYLKWKTHDRQEQSVPLERRCA